MSDFASIMGGAPDHLLGHTVGLSHVAPDWDAYYYILSDNVFLDRAGTSGDCTVDAHDNLGGVRIVTGSGTDMVVSGAGRDSISGGADDDTLSGGAGDDTIDGGTGADILIGGAGNDGLVGGEGSDTMHGGAGDDLLSGCTGDDLLLGEAGNDSLYGATGDDSLYGGTGNDVLVGGSGSDLLVGGAGSDTLFGGSGADVFAFESGFGQDVISDFGAGDRIVLAADLNGTGIHSAADLVLRGMVSGGTTAAGTKYTLLTIGTDTIRLEKVDQIDFIDHIMDRVHVG